LNEKTMMQAGTFAANAGIGSRLRRLPFVLMLTLGLLLSLIHCAGCGIAFAAADSVAVMTAGDAGTAPDVPDQQLPAHSGHCLSHVTAQASAAIALPVDVCPRAPAYGQQPLPPALAGLPLFKPPRV
jgi:hypothetical protein